jgi:electron transfer flavoprotein alpha subunit
VAKSGGIWVFCEVDEAQKLTKSACGLLATGRRLADSASKVLCSILIGENMKQAAGESLRFGSDRAYICAENAAYIENHVQVLESICNTYHPDVFLAAHSHLGQELLPRLAARLNAPIVTNCMSLEFGQATGRVVMTKPVYGGNALATFASDSSPQLATVRPNFNVAPSSHFEQKGEVIPLETISQFLPPQVNSLEKQKDVIESRLEDSDMVISGGRGIGGSEGFTYLRELAQLLGGAVGASRPPCDMKWVSSQYQIGLTGKVVAPKTYFAVAISGMMQHITGMFESKYIIAINKDKDANMFKMADYGVVGDYREILPSFIRNLREMTVPPD